MSLEEVRIAEMVREIFRDEAQALTERIERCEVDQQEVRSWGQRAERAVEVLDRWAHLAGVLEQAARIIQTNASLVAENERLRKRLEKRKRRA